MLSATEEKYLKSIYKVSEKENGKVNTNAVAALTLTSAASVSDMLRRLAHKGLIEYQKYKGVKLTKEGGIVATDLVRRHRLWEYFLVEKLKFSWADVHPIAEDLEHIKSVDLINRLDAYLGHPKFDPHGDPIPNVNGKFTLRNQCPLSVLENEDLAVLIGVKEHDKSFLDYLNHLNIRIGIQILVVEKYNYDGSMRVKLGDGKDHVLSKKVCDHLLVKK